MHTASFFNRKIVLARKILNFGGRSTSPISGLKRQSLNIYINNNNDNNNMEDFTCRRKYKYPTLQHAYIFKFQSHM